MAKFKVTIKKTQTIDLIISATDKLEACILAKNKAKNREWESVAEYEVIGLESGI
jgi:hypothetical protein